MWELSEFSNSMCIQEAHICNPRDVWGYTAIEFPLKKTVREYVMFTEPIKSDNSVG